MEMDEDPADVERAKAFWAEEDVDQVFNGILEYVDHLRRVLMEDRATDKELVQALKLLECLGPPANQDASVVQVVIGSDELLEAQLSHCSPAPMPSAPPPPPPPPAGRGEEEEPLLTAAQYRPHTCCQACLPLPSMPQCAPAFWGQNPLKVPLLCGFKRLTAMMSLDGREEGAEPEDVAYTAPCGQSLRNYDEVMRFLLASESYDLLQVDFFTFNGAVRLDPPPAPGPQWPEMDLSRGLEPTPVQLCVGEGGARPAEFRYRKERWPHGCFLSRGPALYSVCCDCTDGCSDARSCACVARTGEGRRYQYHRLPVAVETGVFECGPWCGCVRARCQNRLVQRGIRLRLQVFQTDGRGWGVRCRDDLDAGTFVCVYSGVMLRGGHTPAERSPPKLTRADLPSDDEVEVVTEWLPPPVLEGRSTVLEPPSPSATSPTSPPLHVPVIQRPSEDRDKLRVSPPPAAGESCDQSPVLEKMTGSPEPAAGGGGGDHAMNGAETKSLKRAMEVEDVYYLDASKEGNVSRFLNHSCQPNLFIQNVFTDCHDPGFPTVAFFTRSAVRAGTELTWDYSAGARGRSEVTCLCHGDGCRGRFTIETLCNSCEVDGHGETH